MTDSSQPVLLLRSLQQGAVTLDGVLLNPGHLCKYTLASGKIFHSYVMKNDSLSLLCHFFTILSAS